MRPAVTASLSFPAPVPPDRELPEGFSAFGSPVKGGRMTRVGWRTGLVMGDTGPWGFQMGPSPSPCWSFLLWDISH